MNRFVWVRDRKNLRATRVLGVPNYSNPGQVDWITEDNMVEVANWCEEHECGRRTSFDTFRFRTRAEITAFLLRWS